MRREIAAYMTVEATLLMPMVLWTVLFVVYALLFTYDRCLMELEVGTLALRGARIQQLDKEKRLLETRQQATNLSEELYVAWECEAITVRMVQDRILVHREGSLYFPFAGWGLAAGERVWETSAEYEHQILRPASFLRMWRNARGLLDQELEKGE